MAKEIGVNGVLEVYAVIRWVVYGERPEFVSGFVDTLAVTGTCKELKKKFGKVTTFKIPSERMEYVIDVINYYMLLGDTASNVIELLANKGKQGVIEGIFNMLCITEFGVFSKGYAVCRKKNRLLVACMGRKINAKLDLVSWLEKLLQAKTQQEIEDVRNSVIKKIERVERKFNITLRYTKESVGLIVAVMFALLNLPKPNTH